MSKFFSNAFLFIFHSFRSVLCRNTIGTILSIQKLNSSKNKNKNKIKHK